MKRTHTIIVGLSSVFLLGCASTQPSRNDAPDPFINSTQLRLRPEQIVVAPLPDPQAVGQAEQQSKDPEHCNCPTTGCPIPAGYGYNGALPVQKEFTGDDKVTITFNIPEEERPDCDREIERIGILIDTAGLTYDQNSCIFPHIECMDVLEWELVHKWNLWPITGTNEASRIGEINRCEFKSWRATSQIGKRAINSLCAGKVTISIYPGVDSFFELDKVYLLVWYKDDQ